ncbi:MAG: tetratricopeptide repeat protein [Candidatus Rifleibacteriota bacterium]
MQQKIIKATILLLILLPASLTAAMDFIFEEKLSDSLKRAEKLYAERQWDETMNVARGIIKDAPSDYAGARRAKDLLILALDGKNKELLSKHNAKQKQTSKKKAREYIKEGTKYLGAKRFSGAAENFSKALKLSSQDSETYFLAGFAHLKAGNKKSAYKAFRKCLELNEHHLKALFHITGLGYQFKRNQEAEKYASILIQRIIKKIKELEEIFYAQKEQQLNDKAIETARKISSLKQNLGQASYMHGILNANRGNHKKAIKSFNRASKINSTSPEIWLQLGKSLLKEKIYHQASLAIEQSIFIRETRFKEIRNKAGILLDEGKNDAAVKAELKARKLKEELAESLYTMAIANAKKRETEVALDNIEKAIEYKPDFIQARYAKAVLLAEKNHLDEALAEMKVVLKRAKPKSKQARKAIKTITRIMDMKVKQDNPQITAVEEEKEKVTDVHKYVKDMPGIGGKKQESQLQDVFPQMKEIRKLFVMRNYSEAIRRLLYLKSKHPDIAEVHAILGQCYMEQGRLKDAKNCFEKAIEIDPHHSESLANYAYILATIEEELPKALKMVNKALEKNDFKAEFHHTKGWVLFKTGEVKKSIVSFLKAVEIKPDYVLARYNLGLAFYIRHSHDKALDAFEQVLAVNPAHHKARLFKAICLAKQNKADKSLLALEALREKLPEDSTLNKVVGDLHARIKLAASRKADLPVPEIKSPAPIEKLLAEAAQYRKDGLVTFAKEKYLECHRLAPKRYEPYYELGEMYAAAGLNKPALRAWKKAEKLAPENFELELNLGKILHKLGQKAEAQKRFNNALTLDDKNPEPRYYLGLISYEEQNYESAESYALAALRQKRKFYKAMALLGMARIKLNRLKPARDIYETLYAQAPSGSSIKRHARKKIWELTRMMSPAKYPSVEDAMQVKKQMVTKVTQADSDKKIKPDSKEAAAIKEYGANTMTVDDKMWVLSQLEKFSTIPTPSPSAPLRPKITQATMDNKEKRWLVKNLQKFSSQNNKYALPPKIEVSKYSLETTTKEKERPMDPSDKLNLAAIEKAEKGLVKEALDKLQQARNISPTNLEVLINLGYLNMIMGNFKNAFDAFAKATVEHPENPLPRLALGNLYWLGGKAEKAIESWKKSNKKIVINQQYNLIARSEKIWKRMLEINPLDADAHSNLGLVYLFSGRPRNALTEFQAVLKIDDARTEHKFYAAQCYVIMYLDKKNKKMKEQARTILAGLQKKPDPFPHAEKLSGYIKKL